MTHIKVQNQGNCPQPHVAIETGHESSHSCSSWVPFVIVGVVAITFLGCISNLGGPKIFPVYVNLYAGHVPIVHKGYLQVYPFTNDTPGDVDDSFSVQLPLNNNDAASFTQSIELLLKRYPNEHVGPYKNCWLENPTANEPCLYDRSWINNICVSNNSYGYGSEKGKYNPCFLLKIKDSGDWMPLIPSYDALLDPKYGYSSRNFDHGFLPVVCSLQESNYTNVEIEVYPPKGFSRLYFPVSSFNSSYYLPPLVAVKVKGLQRNSNFTINCSIVTPNAFVLWNNGRVSITFSTT